LGDPQVKPTVGKREEGCAKGLFPHPSSHIPLFNPLRPSFYQWMRRILRHHHHIPLLLGQRRERGFRSGRGREAPVEEIALLSDVSHDGRRPQR